MPARLAALAVAVPAVGCGSASTTPTPTAAPTIAAAPTTTVVTYADVCAREGGTQGYSTATGVRVCEHDDVILFKRDPADPMGFRPRCIDAGGRVQGTGPTRPCVRPLEVPTWFTPHQWDDPATERYTLNG